ncbi:hypothetical protein GALMADRAFT_236809 [Galerina marginata CBS 339.88]|uniref:Uncharacterized protein n=1 Tax=Galerina marginata (strain CBS 339.88) TaxID=685588 RepID=A0A067TP70_GALM3|nr:hypothetical protein GALMADRAFT_236809 [Galerina marginata CBS 339.88]
MHIYYCKALIQITTADWLYRAAKDDLTPSDEQTRRDYGFARALTNLDESTLLGTYQGLFLLGVDPRTLDEWRSSGTLVRNTISKFKTRAPDRRGAYFPWFLDNHWLFLDGLRMNKKTTNYPSSSTLTLGLCLLIPTILLYIFLYFWLL